jgi:hypothetical protein
MKPFKHTTAPITSATKKLTIIVFADTADQAITKAANAYPHMDVTWVSTPSPKVFFVYLTL